MSTSTKSHEVEKRGQWMIGRKAWCCSEAEVALIGVEYLDNDFGDEGTTASSARRGRAGVCWDGPGEHEPFGQAGSRSMPRPLAAWDGLSRR